MHKALYREYRPLVFDDVIGQDFIIRTLKNQIKKDGISHAYLFCGTRGTGKTSTAKILARAINCTEDEKPCNRCESCTSILDGSSIDVMEIDAASNNSVDDIRELRESVKYTPSVSKYKVYIIDEVHMLSQGAFNALLKTLEEPPYHAVFILATTEPNKIPATILSRCQRFDFKRIPIGIIVDKMKSICEKEGVEVDEDALAVIARNGNGSVRDSLSLLDKCVSFVDKKLEVSDVLDLIGSADYEELFKFVEAIAYMDTAKAIKMIDDFYMWGREFKLLCEDVINIFRSVMLAQIFEEVETYDFTPEYQERILEISKKIETREIIRILNILTELMEKMKNAQNQKVVFEIYIMKLTIVSTDTEDRSIYRRVDKVEKAIEDKKIKAVVDEELIKKCVEDFIIKNKGKINISMKNIDNTLVDKSEVYSVDREIKTEKNSPEMPVDENIVEEGNPKNLKKYDEGLRKISEMLRDKKNVPLAIILDERSYIRLIGGKLYVVFGDNYEFAVKRLSSGDNNKIIKDISSKVFGGLEILFVTEDGIPEESHVEKSSELGDVEKFLIDRMGPNIEFE